MKRSEINACIREFRAALDKICFKLPPFCDIPAAEWKNLGHEYDEIRERMLGWDITDFGLGRFDEVGFALITLRNGNQKNPKYKKVALGQTYFAVQTRKQELIEERIAYIERTEARGKLRESEKRLSQNIYERGVDDAGFARIRSKGDQALFGGYTTKEMKERLGVKDSWPLADFLPTLTIAAKNLATEMTNYNVEEKDLQGESAITVEHIDNNSSVREMLGQRGIKPENLPPSEDIRKLERRVQKEDKQLAKKSGKLHE